MKCTSILIDPSQPPADIRHENFARELVAGKEPAEAALLAGYSKINARSVAGKLAKNFVIKSRCEWLKQHPSPEPSAPLPQPVHILPSLPAPASAPSPEMEAVAETETESELESESETESATLSEAAPETLTTAVSLTISPPPALHPPLTLEEKRSILASIARKAGKDVDRINAIKADNSLNGDGFVKEDPRDALADSLRDALEAFSQGR